MATKIYFIILLVFFSCATPNNVEKTVKTNFTLTEGGRLFTSYFQQQAAEYKALCFQAYNTATLRLDLALNNSTSNKPKAVVTDIDETLLDNSPYSVHQALLGLEYEPVTWKQWIDRAIGDTLAGARTFFNYAASKNVEVFYLTNRDESDREGTLANLKKYDFPYSDNQHLILKKDVNSKGSRRQEIAKKYEIVLLIGDNLADFSDWFDSKMLTERNENVQKLSQEFGKRFIILPNMNYGDWEGALYQYKYNRQPSEKDSLIINALKNY